MMKYKETFNFRIILIMLLLCAASGVSAAALPYYDGRSVGVSMNMTF